MARILVVDDEPDMIWAITNVLLSENHSVISVNSGEEALQKIQETPVDLALLDFRLPGMDGIQILEKMKQIKPEIPVIMVTGYGGIEEAVQSIKLGAVHYIQKPFDNDHLLEIVNKSIHLDHLKKEGLFGKRLAEKIEAKPAGAAPPLSAESSPAASGGGRLPGWLLPAALVFLLTFAGVLFWLHHSRGQRRYELPNQHVSGLSWSGGYLWLSDWFTQSVEQLQFQDDHFIHVKSFSMAGMHLTGIAYAERALYTCDSWKKKIYRHHLDNALTIAKEFASPGPNPSGLFFDGKYLWSCDGTTNKIYQHAADEDLTLLATFASPGDFPVGVYKGKEGLWSASSQGMKIFLNSLNENFRLDAIHRVPKAPEGGQQLASFTLDGNGGVWFTYEGLNTIFYSRSAALEKAQP